MKNIIFFSMVILSTIVGSDDSSKLDDFEESLTKKKTTQNKDSNSSSSEKKSCYYHSYYRSGCDECNDRNSSFFLDLFFDILKSLFNSTKPDGVRHSTSKSNKSKNIEYSKITFDKYPFYSSNGMIKGSYSSKDIDYYYDLERTSFFHTQISKYSLDDSVYGDMFSINYQHQKNVFTFSNKILKEKYGIEIVKKNIQYLMYSRMFSIDNNTLSAGNIEMTAGFGLSKWNSDTYKDSRIRLKYSFNSFFKPFSFNLITGYSFIGNGIFDLEARASYHYKRLSIGIGHQRLKVPSGSLIKGTSYSLGFWF